MALATLKVPISEAKTGWVLAADVCTEEGAVLLARGTVITDYAISRLHTWNIEYISIAVSQEVVQPICVSVQDHSRDDMVFFDLYMQSVDTVGKLFSEMRISKKIPLYDLKPIADGVLEQVLTSRREVLKQLRMVKTGNEYTYNHSLNVGFYCVLLGTWMGYDSKTIRQLATAGLLHDVGKAKIPLDILKKDGPLTKEEYELMKQHTVFGYQLACNTVGLSRHIAMAILQHHEREDGTGYPLKLFSANTHPWGKLVAVADVYDAITSDRIYKVKRTPYRAVDILQEEGFKTLEPHMVQTFLHQLTSVFSRDQVKLSNGLIGTVVHVNPSRPTRPLVQTEEGFIDLDKFPALEIVEIMS